MNFFYVYGLIWEKSWKVIIYKKNIENFCYVNAISKNLERTYLIMFQKF